MGHGDGKGGYPPSGIAPVTPIALVASAIAGASPTSSDNAVTTAIDTTGASLIVVGINYFLGAGSATLSDSKGNTWTALTLVSESTANGRLYYCVNPTVGSGHTFTLTASGAVRASVAAMAFSNAGAFDQESSSHAVAETRQPGSLTPSSSDSLFVTMLASQSNGGDSINAGFTLSETIADTASHLSLSVAYLVQESPAAVNPTWATNLGFAQVMAVGMATFDHA